MRPETSPSPVRDLGIELANIYREIVRRLHSEGSPISGSNPQAAGFADRPAHVDRADA